ncbi:aminotransferase class V-fold PLP-dependent enzyme [Parageobacillus sp. VR-IP]|uniref:aminotransferase class V-fold PLP-dependent enzyme n=1 Tax=Parageobacillus sp. VR-IP TaxID=2742205 RepID=UPI0015824ACA|nr:aminotransferase class V-fold PLP-dependent enzyme [Parageobacillus sp. VR-IP]NUK30498.1 aminotransferase class V-fold PLP-dependent enzyme [Parageobacillus sp. VR-IP]
MDHPYASYRSLFPVLASKIHLASCSQGAISKTVSEAMEEYLNSLLTTGVNWSQSIQEVEKAKKGFAKLIGAEPNEIAVLGSVSDIFSTIATSLSFEKGKNRIVTTDMDFPTVGHVWLAQRKFGANVSFIPSQQGVIPIEYYERFVTSDTLITSISHICYFNGFKQDIKAIAEIVHRKGSLLFVDAYQSAGQVPIDVKKMDIDILAAGTRKYMLGIPGMAFLYMKTELAEKWKPRVTGWFGQANHSKFDIHQLTPAPGARRFETGTPSFISAYAATAAICLLLEIGVENISSYLNELAQFTLDYGQEKGLQVVGPLSADQRGAMTAFYAENAGRIESIMKERNIIVSARNDVIRIAPHFYNTQDEVRRAIDELATVLNTK